MLKDHWDKSENKSISKRMLDKVKHDESLPRRIMAAQREFDVQIAKLSSTSSKLQKMHDTIFQKVMLAQRTNRLAYARVYAQELAQVRTMLKMVNNAKLSLEQVKIRLDTVTELGDVVVTLSPCMSLIKGLTPSLSGVMPQASSSINDLSEMLGDMMSNSSMNNIESEKYSGANSEEAVAIMEEAHNFLVGEAQTAIPDVPSSLIGGGGGGVAINNKETIKPVPSQAYAAQNPGYAVQGQPRQQVPPQNRPQAPPITSTKRTMTPIQ